MATAVADVTVADVSVGFYVRVDLADCRDDFIIPVDPVEPVDGSGPDSHHPDVSHLAFVGPIFVDVPALANQAEAFDVFDD